MKWHQFYIICSKSIDKYYIGSWKDLKFRLEQHNLKEFSKSFTRRADDWEVYFELTDLTYNQARKIEKHIKSMKDRVYIENLLKYSDIS